MNPTVLYQAMGKQLGRLCYLILVVQPDYGKENSEFKLVVHRLKTELVPHLGHIVVIK